MHPRANGLGALTLFVDDLGATAGFYRDVLQWEVVFQDDVSTVFSLGAGTVLDLLAVTAAPELLDPAPVAAVGGPAQMVLSLWVEDVDAVCAELVQRGVVLLNGPVDRAWGKRTAAFADPSGTVWEVAQDIPGPVPGTTCPTAL